MSSIFNATPLDYFMRLGIRMPTIMEIPAILTVLQKYFDSRDLGDLVIISDDYKSTDVASIKAGLVTMGHAWAINHIVFAQGKKEAEDRNHYWGRVWDAFKINAFIDIDENVIEKVKKHCKNGLLHIPKDGFDEAAIADFISPADFKSTEHYKDAFHIIGG